MNLLQHLRRPAVLAVVGALLAPLALGTGAGVALAATDPTLQLTELRVTTGASATSPAPAADPAFASDLAYTASPAGGTTTTQLAYRCASDTEDCVDAATTVVLDRLRLTAPLQVAGIDPAPAVTYFADAAATQPVADPAQAAAFRVEFRQGLDEGGTGLPAGVTGTLTFDAALVTPSGGGTQQGGAVATPSSAAGAGTASRVRVTGEFPVDLATTTAVTWARSGFLSGVTDGTQTPTNAATVLATVTGDPADTLTVQWGGTDPSQRPGPGTVGMLTDLTDLTVVGWPADASAVTVTGWRWTGASTPPAQVAVGSAAAGTPAAAADLLAGLDPATRASLTGLRLVFTTTGGVLVPSGATATVVVGVREHASADATPVPRAGSADYTTTAPAASFDPASDLNTLTVTGTATSTARRGTAVSGAAADTRGFRVLDPRPYAGSATTLRGLSGGTVYGGGYVAATAAGTSWSRRAVDRLTLTVPAGAADVTATDAALDPDLPAVDTRVLGSGLTFAGFGAARSGAAGDGSGVVVTGLQGPADLVLTLVLDGGGTVARTFDATAPAVPGDPAAFGLSAWSEVRGFTAVVQGVGAVVPMGASLTVPYLLQAATSAQAQTYAAHTTATAELGAARSAVTPRTAQSGNRPVTAATVPVAVPTVGVAGSKVVVEPYVATAGGTATAVLEAVSRAGASGHLPDTLVVEDSARAQTTSTGGTTGAAWWDVLRPVSVDPTAPDGAQVVVEYYENTTGAPQWQPYGGSLADLQGAATWRGLRVVTTAGSGTTFPDGTVARARVTFEVRGTPLNGRTFAADGTLTNVAQVTSGATVEGNVVTGGPARVWDAVTGVDPGPGGTTALVKVLSSLQGVEGTGAGSTATLTWGTDGDAHASVVVADAGGLDAGDDVPATGGSATFWDSFDLARVLPVSSGTAAQAGRAYDPYLALDQVTDVRVFADGAWHSLRDEEWSGTAWGPAAGARSDVHFESGPAAGAFPYVGSFPGMSVEASLRARVVGVELVYGGRSAAERDTALPAGDWRRALLPTLTDGAVATTDGPARQVQLAVNLRDTSRADGTPVNDAFGYTGGGAGRVANSGRVTGWSGPDGTASPTDLGAPVNGSGWWTYRVRPASLGVTANKSWQRTANGTPLEQSTDLDQLALPVEGPDAVAAAWPTATLTVTGRSTSTTRVDSLTLTEPRGIDTATDLDASSPFAQFVFTDLSVLTDVDGAAAPTVVLYRWTEQDGLTADAPVARQVALDLTAEQLADVVGVQVRYTGRITTVGTARLSATTRLLAENRVTGAATPAGLTVTNEVEAAVSDARVCADETGSPTAAAGCAAAVVSSRSDARTSVRDPQVLAFPALDVEPVDVQRDAPGGAPVTAVLSAQNFGVTEADQLVLTDADPRYFNAVAGRTVRVDTMPSGAESASLEVLLAGAALEVGADGALTGTEAWQQLAAGGVAGTTWDLAALTAATGGTADDVIGVRVRFADTGGGRITAPGEGFGEVTLTGVLRDELRTGGLPSAVGAEGWRYQGADELDANPGEGERGRVSNHVTAQAVRDGLVSTAQRTADVTLTVHAGAATVLVQKSEVDPAPRKPGDHVRYRITVANTATGVGAADLTGLVVTDRLPEDESLRYGTAPAGQPLVAVQAPGGGAAPLADPAVAADDSGVVLTFGADERLAPGGQVEILLWLRVAGDLSTTTIRNTATAGSVSRPVIAAPTGADGGTACAPGTYDADSRACLVTSAALTVGGANVYVSETWVRDAVTGAGAVRTTPAKAGRPAACAPRGTGADADWFRYPCAVASTAGSTTDWQVQVTSRASISTGRLEMVDMLPAVGDYPAMDGATSGTRGSSWRPVWDGVVPGLVAAAGLPAGATLAVHTTTADYRAGGLAPSASFDPVPGTWSATALTPGTRVPAAQAARVTGFKLVVTFAPGDTFSSGESVRVQWAMRTPLTGAPVATDTWNSFAFRVPADPAGGRPADVTSVPLKAGARYAAAAAGSDPLLAVGDRVWLDSDRDGVQGPGEPGVADALVDLYQGTGAGAVWAAAATTDATGAWLVDGLPAGPYQVRVTLPAALAERYRFTGADAGADDIDSDAVPDAPDSALVADVDLSPASPLVVAVADMPPAWRDAHPGTTATLVDPTRDAGLRWRPVGVGDRVWTDTDRDGVQGPGEDPVPGAVVRLLGPADVVLATTTTGADGGYRFDDLDPGTYRVEVELPAALAERWTFTAPLAGDASADSDVVAVSATTGRTAPFALAPGAGLARVADLAGDPVWAGAAADYADPTRDAGLAERPVRVGDRVWVDLDGDGVQEPGEPGLPGVVLTVTDAAGDPVTDLAGTAVGPVVTDADGAYAFTGLLPGSYTVAVDEVASAAALAPYRGTPAGVGDPATDSSAGTATSAVLVGGGTDDTLDFGFRPLWALGDRVWLDTDRDGVQDAGEPAFPGVTVRLLDAGDVVVATTVTDADGRWRFDALEPGDHRVELELSRADADRYTWTLPRSAAAPRADADSDAQEVQDAQGAGTPGLARTAVIAVGPDAPGMRSAVAEDGLVAAYVDPTWDAGLVERTVAVGDLVWVDTDRDGVQDADEPGRPGVVLELRTPDGRVVTAADGSPVAPVTTGADGRYAFAGLLPGEYVVRVDRIASRAALAGYTATTPGVGPDPALDSSTWTATARPLVGGGQDTTLDFGLVLADDVQLALRKSAVARTADSITWDVTVASTGTQDAYAGFSVVDALPGALTFRTADGAGFACAAAAQVVTCDHDGPLPAGTSATVRIVTGLTAAGADVTNTATVDVGGRGYAFQVLSAQDVAWSLPGDAGQAGTAPSSGPTGGPLAVTGATLDGPVGLAVALLALGAVLLALASRSRGARGTRADRGARARTAPHRRHRA